MDDVAQFSSDTLIERYKMISELGQIVTSEMNLDALFALIMEQTTRVMNSERASVFLYDSDTEQLCTWASTDLKSNSIRISPHCGIAGWVFSNQAAQIINDPYNDNRFFPGVDKKTGFKTRNILCTPLINRNKECIGTLQTLNKISGQFTKNDLELLNAASYYVTIALENARLYENLKALDKAKERVINHLSHEIKTPLSILSGVLHLVKKKAAGGDMDGLSKTLVRGERNVKRLQALQEQIDDILQCQKVGQDCAPDVCQAALIMLDEIVDEKSDVNSHAMADLKKRLHSLGKWKALEGSALQVTPFLQKICEQARSGMNNRKLCVIQDFDENAELRIDRNVLEKVCRGLLKNAIENTPDDGMVEVSIEQNENETLITFTDRGVGITPTNQKLIFSGFFHTQPTALYTSKMPYEFNAGGAGADLLRIKSFAKRLGFEVNFSSTRCQFIPRDEDVCSGRISECRFVSSPKECLSSGGSQFTIRFPHKAEKEN